MYKNVLPSEDCRINERSGEYPSVALVVRKKKKEPQTQRVFRPLMDQANQVTSEAKDLARQFLASHVKEAVCCNIIHYFANGSGTPLW